MTIKELKDRDLILFEVVAGSRAYGLDTADSDTDIKGVFYLPKEEFYGLKYIAQVNNETNDEVYYELGRFVDLLTKSNPNILELLASPADCILKRSPLMDVFKIEELISLQMVRTFTEYAMIQVRKAKGLNKKMNNPMDAIRKSLLDFCYIVLEHNSMPLKAWLSQEDFSEERCGLAKIDHTKGLFALYYDSDGQLGYKGIIAKEDNQEVSYSSIPKGEPMQCLLFVNQEAYSMYCKSYKEYFDWVKKRNETRFLSTLNHGHGYDAKNMMHTLRLLEVSKDILMTGQLSVRRTNRDFLLEIKSGRYTYEELSLLSTKLLTEIEDLKSKTVLRSEIDRMRLEQILIELRLSLYT